MSFLYYESSKVQMIEDAETIPEVKELKSSDKTPGKKFFDESLTYLYWMYKRKGIHSQKLPGHRRSIIETNYLKHYKVAEIEKNKYFQRLKDYYFRDQLTLTEQMYENLKEDIQSFLDYIQSIPFKKIGKIDHVIEVADPDGNPHSVKVKMEVEIDNSTEKMSAIANADKLISLDEKLVAKIKKEEKDTKGKDSRALFD
jgi:hypothetical protein